MLIRWGGDEFVIVAVGPDAERVDELVTRLDTLFAQPIVLGPDVHALGCSIGLGRATAGERSSDDLLTEAMPGCTTERSPNRASRRELPVRGLPVRGSRSGHGERALGAPLSAR